MCSTASERGEQRSVVRKHDDAVGQAGAPFRGYLRLESRSLQRREPEEAPRPICLSTNFTAPWHKPQWPS